MGLFMRRWWGEEEQTTAKAKAEYRGSSPSASLRVRMTTFETNNNGNSRSPSGVTNKKSKCNDKGGNSECTKSWALLYIECM